MNREEEMGLMVNIGFYLVIRKFTLFFFLLLVMSSKDLLLLQFSFICQTVGDLHGEARNEDRERYSPTIGIGDGDKEDMGWRGRGVGSKEALPASRSA